MNPAYEKLQYKRTSSKVELVLPIIVFDNQLLPVLREVSIEHAACFL